MDDWLNEYEVHIEQDQISELKAMAHARMSRREDKFETSLWRFLMQIILREIRVFVLLACIVTLLLWLALPEVREPYGVMVVQSGILGILSLLESFRMFRYHMSEIQFPTKIGMGRLFLFKVIAVTLIEFVLILCFMGMIYTRYYVDGYLLIAYGILSNLLICTCLLGMSRLYHSMLAMSLSYGLALVLLAACLQALVSCVDIVQLHMLILALTLAAACLFLAMLIKCYRMIQRTGGHYAWN